MTTKADWETKPGPPPHQQPKVVAVGSRFCGDNFGKHAWPGERTQYRDHPGQTGHPTSGSPALQRLKTTASGVLNRASQWLYSKCKSPDRVRLFFCLHAVA